MIMYNDPADGMNKNKEVVIYRFVSKYYTVMIICKISMDCCILLLV